MDSGVWMGVCLSIESGVGVLSDNVCIFAAMELTSVWRRRRVSI